MASVNINVVVLGGNLTRDPEVRYTPSGMAVAQFGLAITRKYKDNKTNETREETTFVDIELWGRTAEVAGQYLAKGRPVLVEGRLRLDQWEDKQTGQKRQRMKVVGERFHFLGPAPSGAGAKPAGGAPGAAAGAAVAAGAPAGAPAARPAAAKPEAQEAPSEPEADLAPPEENIPF